MNTRRPTQAELESAPRVPLTSDIPWEPETVCIRPETEEQKELRRLVGDVNVSAIRLDATPSQPQLPMETYWGGPAHDVMLASVSSAYTDASMLPQLVSSVKVASWRHDLTPDQDSPERYQLSPMKGGPV